MCSLPNRIKESGDPVWRGEHREESSSSPCREMRDSTLLHHRSQLLALAWLRLQRRDASGAPKPWTRQRESFRSAEVKAQNDSALTISIAPMCRCQEAIRLHSGAALVQVTS